MEGQTATNPQTGEKIVFRGGQWQPLNATGGPIVGPAAPVKPREAPSGYQFVNGGLAPIPGGPADKPEADPNGPKLPAGFMWKDGVVGGEAVLIKGVPPPKGSSGSLDPKTTEGQANIAKTVLSAAGVTGDKDPVVDLIKGSTSGTLQRIGADAYGAITGDATDGMQNIGRLQTIANDMVLQMSGGSLGAQISDGDRKFIAARMGDIGNPDLPANQRIAAWDQVKSRLFAMSGTSRVEPLQDAFDKGASAEEIMRLAQETGTPTPVLEELLAAIRFRDKGGQGAKILPPEPPTDGGGLGQAFYAGVGDVAEGAGDFLGLVGNPLNAGVNALLGTNLSTDLGRTFRDATGAPDGDPMASAINKGGAAALTGAGLASAARPIASGAASYVTNELAQQPIRQGVAGMAAGGAAETANQLGAPVPVQVVAGLLGGMAGYGAAGIPNALAQPRVASPVAQAAQQQGVQMLPADVGGATTRRLTSAAAQAPLSAPPIVRAAEQANAQFGNATQRATQGTRLAADDAGAVVSKAGERFTKQSRATGGALYTRAEKMAKGVRIKAKGAVQTIDEQIAQLQDGGDVNAPLINALTTFRNSLAKNEGIRIGGMRDIRTGAQKAAYSDDLRSTPANRVFGIVADAISRDIDAGLSQVGREGAAKAFKTADAYWRARVQYIDKVLEPVIGGGKSGESVLQAVESMAQGKGKGVQTLIKLMRSVDKDEAADIQATIIDRLGKSRAGQQNADGTTYSAAEFLTNWNKMSGKGKAALFPDQQVRKNLDELAMIADNMKQAGRFANSSNTGGAIAGQVMLSGTLGAVSLPAFLMGSGAQYLTGRLFASPKFTQWLAKVPANPQALPAYTKRLDAIASAEPIIANDIASVKQFLANAPSSSRAAASQGQDVGEERPIPPQ